MHECVTIFTHILKNFAIRVLKTFTHRLSDTSRYSHASTWSVFSYSNDRFGSLKRLSIRLWIRLLCSK